MCTVWGCIVSELYDNGNISTEWYLGILDSDLWALLAQHVIDTPYCFQNDNEPCHHGRLIEEYKRENTIRGIPWPA